MTAGFPLSISDHPDADTATTTPAALPLDELQDGFVRLRRRDDSRLWFRMSDSTAPVEMRPSAPARAPMPPAKSTENPGTGKLVSEIVRVVEAGRSSLIDVIDASAEQGTVASASMVASTPIDALPKTSATSKSLSNETAVASGTAASTEKFEWRAV